MSEKIVCSHCGKKTVKLLNLHIGYTDPGHAQGGRIGYFTGALADTKEGKAMSPATSATGEFRGGQNGGGGERLTNKINISSEVYLKCGLRRTEGFHPITDCNIVFNIYIVNYQS